MKHKNIRLLWCDTCHEYVTRLHLRRQHEIRLITWRHFECRLPKTDAVEIEYSYRSDTLAPVTIFHGASDSAWGNE